MSDTKRGDNHAEFGLSSAGEERSREILEQLRGRLAASARRGRAIRRGSAVGASVAILAGVAWMAIPGSESATPGRVVGHREEPIAARTEYAKSAPISSAPLPVSPSAVVRRPVTIRVVSGAGERVADCSTSASTSLAPGDGPRVCMLNDQQLLSALAETGGAYGMVRINGQTVILKNGERFADPVN